MKQEHKRVLIVFLIVIALSFLIRILFIEKHLEISDTINIFVAIGTIGAAIGAFYAAHIAIKNTDKNYKISEIKEYIHTLQRLEVLLIDFKRSASKSDYNFSIIDFFEKITSFIENNEYILIRFPEIFNIIDSFILNMNIFNQYMQNNNPKYGHMKKRLINNSKIISSWLVNFTNNLSKYTNEDLIQIFDYINQNYYFISNKNIYIKKEINAFLEISNKTKFFLDMYYNSSLAYIEGINKIYISEYYKHCYFLKNYIIVHSFAPKKSDLPKIEGKLNGLDNSSLISEYHEKYKTLSKKEISEICIKVKEYFKSEYEKVKKESDRREKEHEKKDI